MPEPIVHFDNVVFRYAEKEVLHGLTFDLHPGEIVGLLGPNGAGKSTTLKIIAGLHAPASGGVTVCGLPIPEQAVSVKQKIGYVPESAALFESLTGQEFLELSGRLHDVPEPVLQERIAGLLETFALTSSRSSQLDTYSKGMRQKILIAAALLHSPDLVLLDEPLTGLDVNAAILVKDLLAALAASGKTILYSSHVLDVVEKICNRVLIIHGGNLIANNGPEEIIAMTGETTLEDAFRKLTHAGPRESPELARLIEGLQL
ncbi:MAG: ABC transporter ATP-binding protein [Acidobacteria bacterium]|nr:ABC transporter ATP-binding protein [Acidobacteriota bacterium]